MDGRVKTLHPKIHGEFLGRRGTDDGVMAAHDIPLIDLVGLTLYPFEATVARPDCTLEDAVENIDIGGPTTVAPPPRIIATCLWSQPTTTGSARGVDAHDGHTTLTPALIWQSVPMSTLRPMTA